VSPNHGGGFWQRTNFQTLALARLPEIERDMSLALVMRLVPRDDVKNIVES
jgi:hypothetical protein